MAITKINDRVKKHKEKLALPGNEELLKSFKDRKRKSDQKYRDKKINSENAAEYKKKRSIQSLESQARKQVKEQNQNLVEGSKFKSKKGLTKAVRRIKRNLPKEREKQLEVVKIIAKDLDLDLKVEEDNRIISRQRHYFLDIPELVKEFYLLDSVSRQLPGKKDVITLKSKSGVKEQFQKRVLLTTIEEAYQEFTSLHPQHQIGKSKFFELRPRFVLLMSQTPHNVCCCVYCCNLQYIFDALKPYFSVEIANFDDFYTKFLCARNFECAIGSCEECYDFSDKLKEILIQDCEELPVKWMKWEKNGDFLQKQDMKDKVVFDVLLEFASSFEKFKIHKYLVFTQHGVINEMKKTNSDTSVILHMDFSENFSVAAQDEIQSAFFKRKQISIFTAVGYVGTQDKISFAIINDDTKHQKEQVFYYIKLIIGILCSTYQDLEYINFITDGCAAQFKNKYILSNLIYMESDYGLKSTWHFMPTSHGKSAADGIGGILKRQVCHRILSGLFQIRNAKDFVDCASTFSKNINVLYASSVEMEAETSVLKERWANVKQLPKTQTLHFFEPVGNKVLGAISSKKEGPILFNVV